MLKKFCPRCAKETDELLEGVCADCYVETKKFVEAPQIVSVLVCACGRSNEKKKWVQNASIEEMVERVILSNLKKDKDTAVRIEYEPFTICGKTRVPVTVVAERQVGGKRVAKSVGVELMIIPHTCDVCSRVSGGYYEAILQIRGPKYRQEQMLALVKRMVARYGETDKYSFITQILACKDGVDVYLGSSKVAQKIRQETKRIYNVASKVTHSVCGMRDGKALKRVTILLKASD
ncbi:MAG: NMD3-related protein [archaeon]|nr:NMD3-related protein [archaeon]